MDTVTLVETQIDDGQRLLDRLAEEGIFVRAACWVKPAEEDRWSLYIATPLVDEKGAMEAYRQVLRVLHSLGDVWLTSSDIKLIGEKHSITQDLLDLQQHYSVSPFRWSLLGGMPVEDVYVYSLRKVEVPVYGMTFRDAPSPALHLSLEPHNPHSKLTIESGGQRKEYPAETGMDWMITAPEGATLERDEHGMLILAWDLHGQRMKSNANEVWTFAKLGLHGFRFLRKPD